MAEKYGVPVILHTDHCAKKLLPWIDGLLEAGEKHFEQTGTPLYSGKCQGRTQGDPLAACPNFRHR